MSRYLVFFAVIALASILQRGDSYRILCVFPTPSFSHQIVFRALTLALRERGHDLVIVTPNPINDSTLMNYTEIDISFAYTIDYIRFMERFIKDRENTVNWLNWIQQNDDGSGLRYMNDVLNHVDLRKLYATDSGEKFDLFLMEILFCQSIYPLSRRFDVPMIGISSLGLNLDVLYTIGNPIMSSYPTIWELGSKIDEQLSFWQRLENFISVWKYLYWLKTTYISKHETIARKYFGDDIPDLNELGKNVSLIFVNQQVPISYASPNIPKIIGIGGFHISKEIMTMSKSKIEDGEGWRQVELVWNAPYIQSFRLRHILEHVVMPELEIIVICFKQDLQEFLDKATEGFVYMSLGTNVKSTTLPKKTINEFVTTFSRLPYKVLWKFEDDVLPDKPDNVYIMKWVPQQAVLGHPNLKVFIYQGGLQSTEEAVHGAVPLVGLPVVADQDMQINKMVSLGVAKKLEITTINGDELFEAISIVASDNSYKQRMLNLRSLINDRPHDPLENAIWWTEYVIRHKGVPHLHSTTADEPWYRRQDMDIVAFISAGSVVTFGLTLTILYQLVKSVYYTFSAGSLDAKKIN